MAMIPSKCARVFIILICITITSAFSQSAVKPDERTIAYLNKFRSDISKSVLEKKTEIIQDYYGEKVRLMPEFQKTVMDKNNVLLYHKAFASRFDSKTYGREVIEIMDLGSRVIEFGLLSTSVVLKSTGQCYDIKGKYMDIWERADGNLKLITEAWNYSHPLSIAAQLTFNEVPSVHVALQSHLPVSNSISFELAAYNKLQEMVITEHNPKLWSRFYSDDYMLFYSNHPVYKGREEVDAYLEAHVRQLPVFEKLDIRNDRIDDLGEYVIEYASHIAIVRNGDWSGVSTGKNVRIWRREKNGALRICRGIAMYD